MIFPVVASFLMLLVMVVVVLGDLAWAAAMREQSQREEAALKVTEAAGRALDFTVDQITGLHRAGFALALIAVLALLGALVGDASRTAALFAVGGFLAIALTALWQVQNSASRLAAVLLTLAPCALWFPLFRSEPEWEGSPLDWLRTLVFSLLTALPGLRAIELTSRYHRLLRRVG